MLGQLRIAADVDLVAHELVVGPDLPEELDLAAAQCAPGSRSAGPRAIEAEQLPDAVDAQAARLDRVAGEVALEEPIVETHIALGDRRAAVAVARDLGDAIEHQHRRRWQARRETLRRILDQVAVGEGEQVGLGKTLGSEKFGVLHEVPPKRSK